MKKLIVLLIVALSIPVSAAYIGFGYDENDDLISGVNPLFVDLDGAGVVTPHPGAQSWLFQMSWTGPASQGFTNPQARKVSESNPTAQLEVNRKNQGASSNVGASRNRSSGWAGVLGTGDFSLGSEGYGMNYVKLTLTGLAPNTDYKCFMWAYEANGVWANPNNNYQKFVAYSTTNPKTWLDAHMGQYKGVDNEPNGYGAPDVPLPTTESNMPGTLNNPYTGVGPSLYDMMLGRASESDPTNAGGDYLGDTTRNCASFWVTTNGDGAVVIYEWNDGSDWGGSNHIPLNGFTIIPEPVTIALLGLGGLALIRRKRA